MSSFFSSEELSQLGLKSFGENVLISKKCSIYGVPNISVGNNVRIDDFCVLSGNITIGSNVHIAPFCGLFGGKGILFHDFSGLSSRVTIYTESDDYLGEGLTNPTVPNKFRSVNGSFVEIGKHALVGSGALILPGGSLREGSILGAMSLLKTKTEPWYIYAGVPAKKIKLRKNEIILNYEKEYSNETHACMS